DKVLVKFEHVGQDGCHRFVFIWLINEEFEAALLAGICDYRLIILIVDEAIYGGKPAYDSLYIFRFVMAFDVTDLVPIAFGLEGFLHPIELVLIVGKSFLLQRNCGIPPLGYVSEVFCFDSDLNIKVTVLTLAGLLDL